jgi:ribosome-associated heat shock protein Hsp15
MGRDEADKAGGDSANDPQRGQRLDKWLWFARVVKSRTLAAGLVTGGKVRINRTRAEKPSQIVRKGDVLTISLGLRVRVLEVVAPGTRRGSPIEADALKIDLTPPRQRTAQPLAAPLATREPGTGRPTKRDRRRIDRLTEGD